MYTMYLYSYYYIFVYYTSTLFLVCIYDFAKLLQL